MCIAHHQQTLEYTARRAYSLALWIAPFSKGCNPECLNLGSTLLKAVCFVPQLVPVHLACACSSETDSWIIFMITREKVMLQKLKTVSPVCVFFVLYSSGSCRHLHGGADFHSEFSSASSISSNRHVVISLFLHCCSEFYPESKNFYFQTIPWPPDSDISQLIISASPFKKQSQKVSKIKESKRKQMTALQASPRDTADRSKDQPRCSRPCSYGCILVYIIPSE